MEDLKAIHDIVDTSKMSGTYDTSLIDVEHRVGADLDNGHAVILDANDKIVYAKETDTNVALLCSVEKMYDEILGLANFYNGNGDLGRMMYYHVGDEFTTTAYTGTLAKGDKVEIGANGGFVKQPSTPTPNGVFLGQVVEVKTLGYDMKPAVAIKVKKC